MISDRLGQWFYFLQTPSRHYKYVCSYGKYMLKYYFRNVGIICNHFLCFPPGIFCPDNWVPQPTDATGKETEVHLVQLDPVKDKDEYKKIADEVAKTAAINITKIERVQNPTLFRTYTVRKQRMDEKNGSNVKRLFHGTAAESCAKINSCGFNRSFCGKNGTYKSLKMTEHPDKRNSLTLSVLQ